MRAVYCGGVLSPLEGSIVPHSIILTYVRVTVHKVESRAG
jgi:hypothetical protein